MNNININKNILNKNNDNKKLNNDNIKTFFKKNLANINKNNE
jgi:hypothetical protein